MGTSLPSPRLFLSKLIASIPSRQADSSSLSSSNPLKDLEAEDRQLLLTLHVIFPNELLPALDLLDGRLVTRFRVERGAATAARSDSSEGRSLEEGLKHSLVQSATVYYVQSAQQRSSSYSRSSNRTYDPTPTSYEVRLDAWNCSCPAFAFAAFPSTLDEDSDTEHLNRSSGGARVAAAISGTTCEPCSATGGDTWLFGGLSRGDTTPPVCKHLLACVLVDRCKMFSSFLDSKTVSVEEAAGWAAGWGG
ncbi:hypothetical protein NA57DRAFT_77651 [Rhizodiscina lignyota]|uniref:SWIM-type domain-containing protein n=1 Tax=Rhizodiscina lignyota TaxID=1504668 RepID=A0A9P4IB02_9PEZI|nr:hypothetical protein NA57DRAFT_77651 [Rhizodiscina lignyota]